MIDKFKKTYLLEKFYHISSDLHCILYANGNIADLNLAFTEILGYNKEEINGLSILNLVHQEDRKEIEEAYSNLEKNNIKLEFENRCLHKDQYYIWLSWKMVFDEQTNLIFAVGRDISLLKREEFILNETQKIANVGGWEVDLKDNSIFWSDEVYRIHEVPIGEKLKIEEGINFYHPDYRDLISQYINDAIEKFENWDDELKLITAKGKTIWVRAKGEPIVENGKSIKLRGTFQNIDIRKKEEVVKEKQRQDLRLFMEVMPDLYIRCDSNYKVLAVKCGADFSPTIDTNLLLGESLKDKLPMVFKHIEPLLFEAINNKKEAEAEFQVIKDGVVRINEAKFIPSIEGQAVGFLRDITKQRAKETELIKLNEELSRSNKELEEFAYIASHDLQEPLRKVATFGSRLVAKETDQLSEKGKSYVNVMTKSTTRMQTLIDDLLSYSRVMGVQKKLQEVDLNQVLKGLKEDFELKIKNLNGELSIGEMPTIIGNQVTIHQLFHNLIGNAIKFRQKDKNIKINIYSQENKDSYHIFVIDNGIGIDNAYAKLIFQPFKRLHNKTEYAGTGIGLAICNKIVLQLGGKIYATGELGKGTTFEILIPKKIISGR